MGRMSVMSVMMSVMSVMMSVIVRRAFWHMGAFADALCEAYSLRVWDWSGTMRL